jgi:hypothetical protein
MGYWGLAWKTHTQSHISPSLYICICILDGYRKWMGIHHAVHLVIIGGGALGMAVEI